MMVKSDGNKSDFTEAGAYLLLIAGIGVILIGVYLQITNKTTTGLVQHTRTGVYTEKVSLTGWGIMAIGVVLAGLPARYLIRKRLRK